MTNKFEEIKRELVAMARKDQEMRKIWAESGFAADKYDPQIDKINKEKIIKIINDIG